MYCSCINVYKSWNCRDLDLNESEKVFSAVKNKLTLCQSEDESDSDGASMKAAMEALKMALSRKRKRPHKKVRSF